MMKKLLNGFLLAALLTGCSEPIDPLEQELQSMSLEEKVGQMFILRPESLDRDVTFESPEDLTVIGLQEVNERMRLTAQKYPVGGIILFAHNIKDEEQLERFTQELRELPGHPLLYIDEEGGRVARIGNHPAFSVPKIPSAAALAAPGRTKDVYDAAFQIGTYLKRYGFDVNFAPVADVNTNPNNVVIGNRAFSNDPVQAAPMVKSYLKGLQKAGIEGCIKHFPGHGDTHADTHFGYAMSRKTWEEIDACEMIPFKAGIKAGARMIMSAHISLPNVTGSNIPCTLSPMIMTDKLRGELGYEGIIVSDAMEMGAIFRLFPVQDACVIAIKAGVDMLLCVKDYPLVFETVMNAIRSGDIPESRIDQSVRRILLLRHDLGR